MERRGFLPFMAALLYALTVPAISVGQNANIPKGIKDQHKKLYQEYHSSENLINATRAGKDVDIETGQVRPLFGTTSESLAAEPTYPDPELHAIACGADSIMVGQPTSSETDLTESQDFLYTDYRFRVESVLKTSPGLTNGGEIIVTRPGGELTLNGRKVKTKALDFPLFEIGTRYLLFLRYLPETGTYRAYRSGTFLLRRSGPASPIDPKLPLETKSLHSEDTFLTEVRAAATSACGPGLTRPGLY